MNAKTADDARAPRALLGRGRAYFFAWLLSACAVAALGLFDFSKRRLAGQVPPSGLLAYLLFGAFVALLALPALFLLRIVPETSASSAVRLVRRLIAGFVDSIALDGRSRDASDARDADGGGDAPAG